MLKFNLFVFLLFFSLVLASILIAQSPTKIYWTDNGTDLIQRSDLNGSNIDNLVTGLSWPAGIAVDFQNSPNKIYWTDLTTLKIQRSNLDGSSVEDLVTSGLLGPTWITLNLQTNKMYWTDLNTDKIQRANMDGSNVEDLITTGLSTPQGIAINVSDGKMYWVDGGTLKIQRADLDGSNVEDLINTGLSNPFGIALDISAGKMYWADQGSSKIQRANLDGSIVEDVISSGITNPFGIAVDDGNAKVYWTDYGTQKIQRADVTGSNMEDVVTGLSDVYDVCLNYASGSVDISLPVEVGTFTASDNKGKVLLQWNTWCEINNLGFHVYRCNTEDGSYERITNELIKGAGNSSISHYYSFTDINCSKGFTYWYQLEDIDLTGVKERHGPINVMMNSEPLPTKIKLFQNFPNPFNPIIKIEFAINETFLVSLKIYNIHGQLITTLVDQYLEAGNYKFDFNGTNLSSGIYYYTSKMGDYSDTKKMLLNR